MTTPERTVEEIVEECFKGTIDAIKRIELAKDPVKQYEIEVKKQLTQTLQAERQKRDEVVEEAYDFVSKYKAKYQGCGMADSMLALDEMLQAITQPNNPKV